MPPRSMRNFRLRKDLSVQVIMAWLEILDLEGQELIWGFWGKPQEVISEIFEKYRLRECMGVNPPYFKNNYNCETLLKSTVLYTSQSDIDPTIEEEIRVMDDNEDETLGMRQKVNALIGSRKVEGVKNVVITKSRALLAMLKFLSKKQTMGKDLMEAYEALTPLQQVALRTRNAVIKGELSMEEGIRNINQTISVSCSILTPR